MMHYIWKNVESYVNLPPPPPPPPPKKKKKKKTSGDWGNATWTEMAGLGSTCKWFWKVLLWK